MKINRYEYPFACGEVLTMWKEVFGEWEALMEKKQIDGSEDAFNRDTVWTAEEDGHLLGVVHATVPRRTPALCGISGVCTAPEARGRGVGKLLFARMMEELDARGVQTCFLGTGNPVAAKMYAHAGFTYLPGTSVMIRCRGEHFFDFRRRNYGADTGRKLRVEAGSPALRIPVIPLLTYPANPLVMDVNTDLLNCSRFSQSSCMSLYPRYLALTEKGGAYFAAVEENGMPLGMASVLPTGYGMRTDFFTCTGAESAAPGLIEACESFAGETVLQLSAEDKEKCRIAEGMGYRAAEEVYYSLGAAQIPMRLYRK